MDCLVFVAKIGIFVSDYKFCVRKSGDVRSEWADVESTSKFSVSHPFEVFFLGMC